MNQQSGEPTDEATRVASPNTGQPEITVISRDGVRVVELAGDHDVRTVANVRAAIRGEDARQRENVVLSLERVTFIDSAIVGALFTSNRMLIENGIRLVVHCPVSTPVCQVLRLAHFDDVVDVVGTFQDAIDRARSIS